MSAPTSLDDGALRAGLAWRVSRDWSGSGPGTTPDGESRRSREPVAVLTRELDELCTQATDRFEIAAGLEAVGINDSHARQKYGVASVFELAERMYEMVPRRPAVLGEPEDRWRRPLHAHLVRGLLYSLPSLLYVLTLRALPSGTAALAVLGSTVVSVALAQGMSVLLHTLRGRDERRATRRLVAGALIGGLAALVLFGLVGALLPALTFPAGLLAGAQISYLLSATVLMVAEADRVLLRILSCSIAAGVGVLLLAPDGLTGALLVIVLLACLAATDLAAWAQARGTASRTGQSLRKALLPGDARLAAALSGYGVATAALLSFAAVDVLTRTGLDNGMLVSVAMLPLMAGLGVADWLLHRLRARAITLLDRTGTPTEFQRRARTQLLAAVLGYTGTITGFAVLTCVLVQVFGDLTPLLVLDTLCYGLLGVSFLLITLLLSLGLHRGPLVLTWTALVVDILARFLPVVDGNPVTLAWLHLAVFSLLLASLYGVTRIEYCRVARHR